MLAVTGGTAAVVSAMTTNSRHSASPPTAVTKGGRATPISVPSVLPGPLDGQATARALALRRPIAVMVDDTVPDALPQPGLNQASVVFETVVEGGLTRLMALYLERGAPAIGPVRSARPYFVQWAAGYGALLVHAGGSPAAQRLLFQSRRLASVEATLPGRGFYRSSQHLPPHDLYGSTATVWSLARRHHWDRPLQFSWLPHSRAALPGLRGGQQTVTIDFSSPAAASPSTYTVMYSYDPQSNTYGRSMGGNLFTDRDTGAQLQVTNLVVLFTRIRALPGDRAGRVRVAAIGRGEATYFRDGHAIHGRWVKLSAAGPLQLLDDRGRPFPLAPGNTWIEVAPPGAVRTGSG